MSEDVSNPTRGAESDGASSEPLDTIHPLSTPITEYNRLIRDLFEHFAITDLETPLAQSLIAYFERRFKGRIFELRKLAGMPTEY